MRRSKKRKLRAETEAAKERKERQKERQFVASNVKAIHRKLSLRSQVVLHDKLLGAILLELRNFVAETKQATDTHAIMVEVLAKKLGGVPLTEDDQDVLDDYLANLNHEEDQPKEEAPSAPPPAASTSMLPQE